ncbi:MAG TPA: patatin-like phospholipase family protein [Solirubrobacterales bacterium]|nr:patatin-like phospholipase family protein [Solirubrobacterales bacterium]
MPSYLGVVEDPEQGKLGVCCSGGGIRSAAFSLGALQVLQEQRELRRASYLAAVSGGSYIAAAISMVAKTGRGDSDPDLIDDTPAFAQGSPEEQYLRDHCSYMAPTALDKAYLGLRIVLGLLVNLVFVSLPLVGLALVLTGFLYGPHLPGLTGSDPGGDYAVDLPLGFWLAPAVLGVLGLLAGGFSLLVRLRRDEAARFFVTWTVRLLLLAGFVALFTVAVPYLVEWMRDVGDAGASAGSVAGANKPKVGIPALGLLVGIAAQLVHLLRSKATAEEAKRGREALGKLGSASLKALAYAAGAIAGPLLLLFVYVLAVAMGMAEIARSSDAVDWWVPAVGCGVLAFFALVYFRVDLTTWSLHPFYKRRLSSAFALKRVRANQLTPAERDRTEVVEPSPQGIAVERDYDELVPISETALDEGRDRAWPTLLVCAAANISDTAATPPGRDVTSFTFSAKTVGGPLVGAIGMSSLEQDCGYRDRDFTLPAAVAMSGAAISPSMGKMTAKPLRFLMALANVRLGVWVPNPRWVAAEDGKPVPARPRPSYLLRELFGWNSVSAKYLYVTDGGHYENLGLVELLRRGCTHVYCLDASGLSSDGDQFGSLGEAIALARSELGVEISFDGEEGRPAERPTPADMVPDEKSHFAKDDVVTARIKYRSGEEGRLVYVRNAMTQAVPWDVHAHHEADPRFPNNSTVDQLYTDQKFEAYRVLGSRAAVRAVEAMGVGDDTA